jgi:hypothetical protein
MNSLVPSGRKIVNNKQLSGSSSNNRRFSNKEPEWKQTGEKTWSQKWRERAKWRPGYDCTQSYWETTAGKRKLLPGRLLAGRNERGDLWDMEGHTKTQTPLSTILSSTIALTVEESPCIALIL